MKVTKNQKETSIIEVAVVGELPPLVMGNKRKRVGIKGKAGGEAHAVEIQTSEEAGWAGRHYCS